MKQEVFDRLVMFLAFLIYIVLFEAWLQIAPDPGWGNIELVFLSVPVLTAVLFYGLGWAFLLGTLLFALYMPIIWPALVVGKVSILEVAMRFALIFAVAIGAEIFRRYEVRKRYDLADLAERLKTKVAQQQSLIKAQQALGSNLDLTHQLEQFLRWATKLVSAKEGYIALFDKKSKRVKFTRSEAESGLEDMPAPVRQLASLSSEEFTEERIRGFMERMNETDGSLCVPLVIERKLSGSLCLISDGRRFSETDVELIELLGAKAQVAIENAHLHELNTQLFVGSLVALAKIIDARDPLTKDHSDRVARYAEILAKEIGYGGKELATVVQAGELHDIGRIIVPDAILKKPGKLTKAEFEEVKKHPQTGYDLLSSVKHFKEILPAVRHHHERFDGTGYPDGLAGADIPLIARIIAVADVFEAVTADRAHRGGKPPDEALVMLRKLAGDQLDPELVKAFGRAYTAASGSKTGKAGKK